VVVEERCIRSPAVPELHNLQHHLHHTAAAAGSGSPAVVVCILPVEVLHRTAVTAGHTVGVARTAVVAVEVGRSPLAHHIRPEVVELRHTGLARVVPAGRRADSF